MLKAIAGLVLFEGGEVHCAGHNVSGRPAHEMVRIGIGLAPQTGNVFTTLSVQENLIVGGHMLDRAMLRDRLAAMFSRFPRWQSVGPRRPGCCPAASGRCWRLHAR